MRGRKRKVDKGGKQSSAVAPEVEKSSSTKSSENKSIEPQKIVPVFTNKKRKLVQDKPKTIESVLRDEDKDRDSQKQTSQESVTPELGTNEKQNTAICGDDESKPGTGSTVCPFSFDSGAKLNTVSEDHMTEISKSEKVAGGSSLTDMNLVEVKPKIVGAEPIIEKALVTRVGGELGTRGEELILKEDGSEIKADIPQTIGEPPNMEEDGMGGEVGTRGEELVHKEDRSEIKVDIPQTIEGELPDKEEDRETNTMDDGIKMSESEPKIDKSMIVAEKDQSNGNEIGCKLTQKTEGVMEDTMAMVEESHMGNDEPQPLIENNSIPGGENMLQDATYGVKENLLLDLSQSDSKDWGRSPKLEEVSFMKLLHSHNNDQTEPTPTAVGPVEDTEAHKTEHGLQKITGDIQQKTELESEQSPVNDGAMTVGEGFIYSEAIIESRTTEAKPIKEQSEKQEYHSVASCSPKQTETTTLQESYPSTMTKSYEDLDVPVVPTQTFTISYSPNLSQDTPISGPSSPIKLSRVVESDEQSMVVDMNFVNNLGTSLQTLTNKSPDDVSEKMCHRTTSTIITQQADADTGELPRCLSTIKSESLPRGLKGEKTERADNSSYTISETAQVPLDISMDDDFEVTDSQLCAVNIDVPLTRSKPSSVSIKSLDAKIDIKEREGHIIMEGFINDASKLNKLILKTKREIDAMKRRKGQNFPNQNWHSS